MFCDFLYVVWEYDIHTNDAVNQVMRDFWLLFDTNGFFSRYCKLPQFPILITHLTFTSFITLLMLCIFSFIFKYKIQKIIVHKIFGE
jgi:hypothetical protein